jgi:leucyl aminopeptidase
MSLSVEVVEPDQLGEVATVGVFALAAEADGEPTLVPGIEGLAGRIGAPSALDPDECRRESFGAKVGQVLRLPTTEGRRMLVIGLGAGASLDDDQWRRGAAAFVRAAGEGHAALLVPADAPGAALAEGAILSAYRFDAYRSKPAASPLEKLVIVADAGEELRRASARGAAAADAVCFARDLVNTPPSDLNPTQFAQRISERLRGRAGTTVEVWDEDKIESEQLGGLLTVARGSSQPPRLVLADFTPEHPVEIEGRVPHIVLVGKGITFDSGGLSLKTADGMMTMKTDMSGAAIVMGALSACGELDVRVKVTAIAMVTENMPGPNAVKPGDVFRARNGATIEVLNTDAEGRLVLADGLSLAAELRPDAIIDVATLTGAAVVALGRSIGALFGSDQALIDGLQEVGRLAGEPLWPLPLPEQYADHIDSEVADMKNTGKAGEAGSISAAILLSRFVGSVPWAHLDIAGPARAAESSGYLTKGGTAFGVRTLIEFLRTKAPTPAG